MGKDSDSAGLNRRNARERCRIRTVNGAFDVLREHVPSGRQQGKKISKVETLKSAIEYIKALQEILEYSENFENNSAALNNPIAMDLLRNQYLLSNPLDFSRDMYIDPKTEK